MEQNRMQPLLFDAYQNLKNIPHISLGSFPTPIEKLQNLGVQNLWIKRDDKSSPLYGGNKVRKLEFLFGDVLSKKKNHVITMGGVGTNHGLATAAFAQKLGLGCTLYLFTQPPTSYVQRNLRLFEHFGAHPVYCGSLFRTALTFITKGRLKNFGASLIPAGGSDRVGTLGFVNAVFELKAQVEEGSIPEPDKIFCPLGSNGTLAGLSLGVKLAGMKSKVIGVRVAAPLLGPLEVSTGGAVLKLMNQTYGFMKKHDTSLPKLVLEEPEIIDDYFGSGYGCSTGPCLEAMELMKEKESIALDPCYTAKTFAGVLNHCKNHGEEKVLYWHTYNSVDLNKAAEGVDVAAFPPELRSFLERPPVK